MIPSIQVFQRIYSAFASPDVWEPCPEGARAMRHAKDRGLIVGAVSNVYPRYVDTNLPLLGLHRDLDFAATSYDVILPARSPTWTSVSLFLLNMHRSSSYAGGRCEAGRSSIPRGLPPSLTRQPSALWRSGGAASRSRPGACSVQDARSMSMCKAPLI